MKKILAVILSLICISACNKTTNKAIENNDGKKMVYNNLQTKQSRNDLKNIMSNTDIS